jgi:hypothetical protein
MIGGLAEVCTPIYEYETSMRQIRYFCTSILLQLLLLVLLTMLQLLLLVLLTMSAIAVVGFASLRVLRVARVLEKGLCEAC